MKKMTFAALGCVFFVIPLLSGCSEKLPEGMPSLQKVTLQFTQENTPLAGASIRLVPESTNPWTVGGSTDDNGKIVLKTHGKHPGVPVGKYKICVNKFESEGELPTLAKPAAKPMKNFNLVETKYTLPNQTPLEIEIVSGKNVFPAFDLGKPVRIELKTP